MRRPGSVGLPILMVLLSACGDDGPRTPPAIDGAWEGEATLDGAVHEIDVELETARVVETEGAFGPSSVAHLTGEATVRSGDSATQYGVTGQQEVGLSLELGSRYLITGAYSGGPTVSGWFYDLEPPGEGPSESAPLSLRRVGGS